MKQLADIALRFIELIEAEGRVLRKSALRFCYSLVLFAISGVLVVTGILMVLAALNVAVSAVFGQIGAHLLTGLGAFAAAGAFLALSFGLVRDAKEDEQDAQTETNAGGTSGAGKTEPPHRDGADRSA